MAVVLGAMGKLAPKLLQLLQSEYELQKNVKRKVEFVTRELESIEAALHKVAAVPWDQLDEQVKVWARQVRDASYDMEDVLDTFLVRVEGGEPVNRSRLKRALKKMGGLFGKFKARRDITGAIDGIEKQLQEVADRRARYKLMILWPILHLQQLLILAFQLITQKHLSSLASMSQGIN